ncbi:MAG: hypothetical protein AABW50_01610 [Nanoarchaeota archaeon]
MFGILDRLYVMGKKKVFHEDIDWRAQITDDNFCESWYCFVPKVVAKKEKIRKGILPQKGKVSVYTTSYVNLIVPNAIQTRDNLREIYYDSLDRMSEDVEQGRKISVLGVSIGNVLSVRLASEVPYGKLNSLVSIVGGGRLGMSAWDSIATKSAAQNSGFSKVEEYEEVLSEFAPIKYLGKIHAERVFARFGSSDLMIRYNPHGQQLRQGLENMDSDVKDIKTYLWADHSSTILKASGEEIYR